MTSHDVDIRSLSEGEVEAISGGTLLPYYPVPLPMPIPLPLPYPYPVLY
jgi:hypothetical protein